MNNLEPLKNGEVSISFNSGGTLFTKVTTIDNFDRLIKTVKAFMEKYKNDRPTPPR